jgi:meso-butanediol dehydrogenase/(S,S)-butanediol dehydrogenase/diacetyl reductase
MRLKGKVAIVTGGGKGIGRGIVVRLASEGAKIVISAINSSTSQYKSNKIGGYTAAKKLAEDLKMKGTEAIAIEADVNNQYQVEHMIAKTVETFGRVDIVVNCAAVISVKPVADLTIDDWNYVMDTNAKGTFLVNKAASAQMKKQGGGKIINFSSEVGKKGEAKLAHYCASKFAVIGFTKSLALEVAKENITVNVICPGVVDTQMHRKVTNAFRQPGQTEEESYDTYTTINIPQGVPQTPEDMAEAVMFIAVSDHVTGQAISIDGGTTI